MNCLFLSLVYFFPSWVVSPFLVDFSFKVFLPTFVVAVTPCFSQLLTFNSSVLF